MPGIGGLHADLIVDRLFSLQEACHGGVQSSALPIIDVVLEASQELEDLPFNHRPHPVTLSEEAKQMLVQAQVASVHRAIDLRRALDAVVVDLKYDGLEVLPGLSLQLQFVGLAASGLANTALLGSWRMCLDRGLEEVQNQGRCRPNKLATDLGEGIGPLGLLL